MRFVNLCAFFVCLVFEFFKLNLSISQNRNSQIVINYALDHQTQTFGRKGKITC